MTTSDRIRQRREALGLSQDELAQRLGYKSRTSINKIELDAQKLPIDKIESIANALDTTPSYIMGWTDEVVSPPLPEPSKKAQSLLQAFERLNPAGQSEAVKRVSELSELSRYVN